MQEDVEGPMVEAGLVSDKFLDSWALNIYHDGSQGIQPHYDDSARFERPVYSLRLFSDSRLSFGTQLYGNTNGAFCVDMPRGAITLMHAGGYAIVGAKHCVRPVDLAGKKPLLTVLQAQQMLVRPRTYVQLRVGPLSCMMRSGRQVYEHQANAQIRSTSWTINKLHSMRGFLPLLQSAGSM